MTRVSPAATRGVLFASIGLAALAASGSTWAQSAEQTNAEAGDYTRALRQADAGGRQSNHRHDRGVARERARFERFTRAARRAGASPTRTYPVIIRNGARARTVPRPAVGLGP